MAANLYSLLRKQLMSLGRDIRGVFAREIGPMIQELRVRSGREQVMYLTRSMERIFNKLEKSWNKHTTLMAKQLRDSLSGRGRGRKKTVGPANKARRGRKT